MKKFTLSNGFDSKHSPSDYQFFESMGPTPTVKLTWIRGHWIDMNFVDNVQAQVEIRLFAMDVNASYTAKKICGNQYWSQLSSGQQKYAGICVSYLVETGALPLVAVGKTNENAQQYQLA